MAYDLLTILGPTATGKTRLAACLAKELGGEVLSADSRMVYRGMDIGTGKDLADYVVDGQEVPYHLVDIVEAGYRFNLHEFQCAFQTAYMDIMARRRVPILCGGTGLYIEAVLKGYATGPFPFPERRSLTIGLSVDRERRRERISRRLRQRLDEGMLDEVRGLLTRLPAERLLRYGLEYRYVTLYLTGELTYDVMVARLETAIHQFAKRQMTWFRGMEERRGVPILWLDAERPVGENVAEILRLWNEGGGLLTPAD